MVSLGFSYGFPTKIALPPGCGGSEASGQELKDLEPPHQVSSAPRFDSQKRQNSVTPNLAYDSHIAYVMICNVCNVCDVCNDM